MNSTKSNIKYGVNEIFYSVQAEGMNAGRPAVFIRLAGCNLSCPFCDTNHTKFARMTKDEIEAEVKKLDPTGEAMIVFTGGEPTLQLTSKEELCKGRFRAIETNGILKAPRWIRHVTISPKTMLSVTQLERATEIKCLYGTFKDDYLVGNIQKVAELNAIRLFIQPLADKDGKFDVEPAINFAKAHPLWTLSLQWHKLFNIR